MEEQGVRGLDDACYLLVRRIDGCEEQRVAARGSITARCRDFVNRRFSYGGCVEAHRYDEDFHRGNWRIYLNRREPLWNDLRDTIILYDQFGNEVDRLVY